MQALEPDEGESSSPSEFTTNSTAIGTVYSQIQENAAVSTLDSFSEDTSSKELSVIVGFPIAHAESVHDEIQPYHPLVSNETVNLSQFNMALAESDGPSLTINPIQDQNFEVAETIKPEPMNVDEDVAHSYPDCIDGQNDAPSHPQDTESNAQLCTESNINFEVSEPIVIKIDTSLFDISPPVACIEETVTCQDKDVLKLDATSEDEEINFYLKSGAESSSSKEESPSGPSCSGTSRTGINSLSSESEDDLPNVNISLPIKKRKRETNVQTINSSSCSEDENKCEEIDYANLKPEEIKALIEEARRYGSIKRKCKCPKKKWEDLPIIGPTEHSGRCTIGKGDWSEKLSLPCAACSAGACHENHRHGRRRRRGPLPRMSLLTKSRAKGTIGEDVPIIELSDSEDVSPVSNKVTPEATSTAIPPAGECIVLSSSDDDDVVCEQVIKTEVKNVGIEPPPQSSDTLEKIDSPDVVVLNASVTSDVSTNSIPSFRFGHFSDAPLVHLATTVPTLPPHIPQVPDAEPWPDCNIDLDSWDETLDFLSNIVGPGGIGPEVNTNVNAPERPSTPEGWSCPICLEPKTGVNEIMSTTCGHVFCGNCIRSAVKLHKKCPTCRKKLTPKQFHKIFL